MSDAHHPHHHEEHLDDEFEGEFVEEGPSRSQKKREVEALQKLGEALIDLDSSQLAQFELPAPLIDAISVARRIRQKHSAYKRQRQFIGKLMREVEPGPIEAALERMRSKGNEDAARLHLLERWRERLIAEGDTALTELIDEYPAIDPREVRQLIRNAQREAQMGKPPASARQLFRLLRESID